MCGACYLAGRADTAGQNGEAPEGGGFIGASFDGKCECCLPSLFPALAQHRILSCQRSVKWNASLSVFESLSALSGGLEQTLCTDRETLEDRAGGAYHRADLSSTVYGIQGGFQARMLSAFELVCIDRKVGEGY